MGISNKAAVVRERKSGKIDGVSRSRSRGQWCTEYSKSAKVVDRVGGRMGGLAGRFADEGTGASAIKGAGASVVMTDYVRRTRTRR